MKSLLIVLVVVDAYLTRVNEIVTNISNQENHGQINICSVHEKPFS